MTRNMILAGVERRAVQRQTVHGSYGGGMSMHHLGLASGVERFLSSSLPSVVVLYVGPDQLLPLASAVGATVGVLLMAWHRVVAVGRRVWHLRTKKRLDTAN